MLEEWPQVALADVLADVIDYRGKAPPKSEFGVQLITARNVRPGNIDLSYEEYIRESEYETWMNRGIPSDGDILFTTEAPLGNVCMFPREGKYAVGQRIVTLRVKSDRMNPHFLCCYLQSEEGQTRIMYRSTGSTAKGIKSRELMKVLVRVPPLDHQRKIAEILRTWDEAIEACERLVAVKKRRLAAARQKLFAATRPGADPNAAASWDETTLGAIFTEIGEANPGLGPEAVITVGKYAIRRQVEHFTRSVASANLSNYQLLAPGDFVYDPMSAYYGAIGRYAGDAPGIVSPAYTVIRLAGGINPTFVEALLKSHYIAFELENRSSQGNREGKRRTLRSDEFSSIPFMLPPRAEQDRIASALGEIARDCDLTAKSRDALTKQKRGLMQKLLTGEWRVEVDSEAAA